LKLFEIFLNFKGPSRIGKLDFQVYSDLSFVLSYGTQNFFILKYSLQGPFILYGLFKGHVYRCSSSALTEKALTSQIIDHSIVWCYLSRDRYISRNVGSFHVKSLDTEFNCYHWIVHIFCTSNCISRKYAEFWTWPLFLISFHIESIFVNKYYIFLYKIYIDKYFETPTLPMLITLCRPSLWDCKTNISWSL
jgi:hypothetical protein